MSHRGRNADCSTRRGAGFRPRKGPRGQAPLSAGGRVPLHTREPAGRHHQRSETGESNIYWGETGDRFIAHPLPLDILFLFQFVPWIIWFPLVVLFRYVVPLVVLFHWLFHSTILLVLSSILFHGPYFSLWPYIFQWLFGAMTRFVPSAVLCHWPLCSPLLNIVLVGFCIKLRRKKKTEYEIKRKIKSQTYASAFICQYVCINFIYPFFNFHFQ